MNDLLFVYGTLMQPFNSEMTRLLKTHSTLVSIGYVTGRLYDLGAYPGLVYDPNEKNTVKGEIRRLHSPDQLFPFLDNYEMIDPAVPENNEYIRTIIPVQGSEQYQCWTYIYQFPISQFPLIASGDYLSYFPQNPNHQHFIDNSSQ